MKEGTMRLSAERQYLATAREILTEGEDRTDRTGTGTISLFGTPQMTYDLREGFPLLTTKKVPLGAIATELTWMLQGDSNIRYLNQHNTKIWNEWPFVSFLERTGQAIPEQDSPEWQQMLDNFVERIKQDPVFAAEYGELGPVYGRQWRYWSDGTINGIDQLADAQEAIRHNSDSRRIIVSAWNVGDIEEMSISGLPPCHMMYQFYASQQRDEETGKPYLDMKMYQRSGDFFLGVPFNMAQYALLLSYMAQSTDRVARRFTHTFGDAHIYSNHVDQVNEQLGREPRAVPKLLLNPDRKNVWDFTPDDAEVVGYDPHPAIKAPIAV